MSDDDVGPLVFQRGRDSLVEALDPFLTYLEAGATEVKDFAALQLIGRIRDQINRLQREAA